MSLRHLLEPGELQHLNAVADWLRRPRRGYVIDEIRRRHGDTRYVKRRADRIYSLEQVPTLRDTCEPVLEQLVRKERREAVRHAVHNLAAPQRRVALMRMQGHSVKQMAEALGCTTHAVDYHMRGAKFHLARALANV